MLHYMNLHPQPFQMIASGQKTIELRLNDEKRRRLQVGDRILFTNTRQPEQTVLACVRKLHPFSSFRQLYEALSLEQCGYLPEEVKEAKPEDMYAYYSSQQEQQWGVLGIELTLCDEKTHKLALQHRQTLHLVPGAENAVLMIHGICCTPRHFDFLMPSIPENWSVHSLLLDGHGGTVRDFSKASMARWKRQTEDALQDLCKTHKRVLLVGYSLGCLLGMEAAQQYPQVKAMLLLNPPLHPMLHPKMVPMSLRMAFGKVNTANPREAALFQDIGIALEPWLWKYIGWIPRFWELLVLCGKCRPVARKIAVPCEAFLAKKDEMVSLRSRKHFENNPSVTLHYMQEAGHSYYTEEDRRQMAFSLQKMIHNM